MCIKEIGSIFSIYYPLKSMTRSAFTFIGPDKIPK